MLIFNDIHIYIYIFIYLFIYIYIYIHDDDINFRELFGNFFQDLSILASKSLQNQIVRHCLP